MNLRYKRATMDDIEHLVRYRIIVLKAANKLPDSEDMSHLEANTLEYYSRRLRNESHIDI